TVKVPLNLEMGLAPEILAIALRLRPDWVTLVPEKRQELTTEGGLDVRADVARVRKAAKRLKDRGIVVSLFVDPDRAQIEAAAEAGADAVELHTGAYANARLADRGAPLRALREAAAFAKGQAGLGVHAGHGLTYGNTAPVAEIPEVSDLAIGHSIVARAVLVGMERAVREMTDLIRRARE
ncbi:MAG: pyridoxine 5'-phosphate synthase, partial [Planctomycetes bacterium]|nr:pyridoxine 5'-phosphate synthase [Planctomycetota bacterium]